MQNTLICPHCGGLIELIGTVKKVKTKTNLKESDIKGLFPKGLRSKLNIDFEENFAKVSLKGTLSKRQWNSLRSEAQGYGGKYVKGFFLIPIAGVHNTGEEVIE